MIMGRWNFLRLWKSKRELDLAPKDADAFLKHVAMSGLVSDVELHDAVADFRAAAKSANALEDLCERLISKGLLTSWQCDKLRMGKWKGFFLDGYCLISHLSKDETTSTYLCKEVATGKQFGIVSSATLVR
jgi:eukaryotic-like serine/threonine-protein kinase